jgi:hypothetical protein
VICRRQHPFQSPARTARIARAPIIRGPFMMDQLLLAWTFVSGVSEVVA